MNKVKGSVLFIKSLEDKLIPPSMTDQLRAKCNESHI
jgi:hypothetical protein